MSDFARGDLVRAIDDPGQGMVGVVLDVESTGLLKVRWATESYASLYSPYYLVKVVTQ